MPFFVRADIIALQQYPAVNASLEGDNVRYHRHVSAGIAVALDWGCARSKKLMPAGVEGATFTIRNPRQFDGVFGLTITNQPNVAIMGVGGITKQPFHDSSQHVARCPVQALLGRGLSIGWSIRHI
jgi:pyruvate dehydrogenase E2 component (dihydrolipoyllysine-residue acetyltransferase)